MGESSSVPGHSVDPCCCVIPWLVREGMRASLYPWHLDLVEVKWLVVARECVSGQMTRLQCWKKDGCIQSCRHLNAMLPSPSLPGAALLCPSSTGWNSPVLGPPALWLSSRSLPKGSKKLHHLRAHSLSYLLDLPVSVFRVQMASHHLNLLEMQDFQIHSIRPSWKLWRMDYPTCNPLGDSLF